MANHGEFSSRRSFFGMLATGAAALGATTLLDPMRLFGATAAAASPSGDASFDKWLGKIKGTHKQVFDCMMPDGGMPLAWTRVFLMSNKAVGVADGDCTAVLVLRHEAIPLAMEDRLWSKYKFGEVFKITDKSTNTPAVRNAFWKPKPKELPLPGMALDELLETGAVVGVCDMALTVYSSIVAGQMKMDADECKKDWVSGVLPGIQIVPSGVLAVNRAQEHGCTYCWAG
jgi:intracellular sulfur oxidation DsrE/DsrF family protein